MPTVSTTLPAELRSDSAKLTSTFNSQQWPIVGIDVSRWQKKVNWERALSAGISFAFIKASEGSKIIDSQFERNINETARLGVPRGIYHFLKPSHDWKKQVELFSSLVNTSGIELDPVVDIERHDDLKKSDLANLVEKFVKGLEDAIGQAVMIYTSAGFWNQYMPITGWVKHKRLWIASWTSHFEPTLPDEWAVPGKSWTFWQWSAKNQLGQDYGVATKSVDLNRFNGSTNDFLSMYNLTSLPGVLPPVDPPDPPDSGGLLFQVTNPYVHLFDSPSVRSRIAGDLETGDVVEVTDITGSDEVWIQIENDKWALLTYNGQNFLHKVN